MKSELLSQGYPRQGLTQLPEDGSRGSRELLLALSWLLARQPLPERLLAQTRVQLGDEMPVCEVGVRWEWASPSRGPKTLGAAGQTREDRPGCPPDSAVGVSVVILQPQQGRGGWASTGLPARLPSPCSPCLSFWASRGCAHSSVPHPSPGSLGTPRPSLSQWPPFSFPFWGLCRGWEQGLTLTPSAV